MTSKKIIFLTRYTRLGASSRLRTFQYIPFLKGLGWEVTISPLFNDLYLNQLYKGKGTSYFNILTCYLKRFFVVFILYKYDRVVIEKEIFPFLPAWTEYILHRTGQKFVVDYDDAVFHNYDLHPSYLVRLLLNSKIGKVMEYSHKVLAGNAYLAEWARKAGAQSVILLPTVLDESKYFSVGHNHKRGFIKIGWIGSPTTLKYLKGLLPVLNKLNNRQSFELIIIGGESIGFKGKETLVSWSEEGEVKEIQQLDIGIMPLTDSPWEEGKCGYKLIQYMACGLPVVGSAVGVNIELISPGENGFLASNPNEWEKHLEILMLDRDLRYKMGCKGLIRVKNHYSIQNNLTSYLKALEIQQERNFHLTENKLHT
jgi:glycosyltransferase involved in cell wall biosynthesis